MVMALLGKQGELNLLGTFLAISSIFLQCASMMYIEDYHSRKLPESLMCGRQFSVFHGNLWAHAVV